MDMTLSPRPALERAFPFWETLTEEQRALLEQNTVPVSYAREEAIHHGSLDCIGVLLLQTGRMRVHLLSEDGRDVTLYRLQAGDVCLLTASCILREITFDVFVDAEEPCRAFLIPAPVFRRLTGESLPAQLFEYQLLAARFSDVMWAMQQILFLSFDKRLAIFLTDELARTGSRTVRMTHEQIARHTGSAREVVSRMLKYFETEGMVALSRGAVEITDPKRLRALTQ